MLLMASENPPEALHIARSYREATANNRNACGWRKTPKECLDDSSVVLERNFKRFMSSPSPTISLISSFHIEKLEKSINGFALKGKSMDETKDLNSGRRTCFECLISRDNKSYLR